MNKLIIGLTVFLIFFSCSEYTNSNNNIEVEKNDKSDIKNQLNYDISKQLYNCVPENWSVWEEHSEKNKTYLAHIGKGIFDLHFKANYEVVDTLQGLNYNGKNGNKYSPEIVLHFYKNEKDIEEAVKFTQENSEIISDIKFALDFGETDEYLVYECLNEKQLFSPKDNTMQKLRECLIEKITLYSN